MLMVISQRGDTCVNIEIAQGLSVYYKGKDINKYCIIAHFGPGDENAWDLGVYDTEDRAIEIIDQLMDRLEKPVYVDVISKITTIETMATRSFEVVQKRPEWKYKVFFMPQR